ncbi:CAP domain-containing protein [Inconstantimicrobium mannanitabidum]|uniref:Serine protease n=1 Tax=Inconstantimicrobium mannanitabidum TaxID=1604901 RepID=A0ACB5RDG4_9CLOT|nr:CAP domain-containing protein [Clostridium sp. TW13]GKX67136.1 serine protease [Clostridium sp. TW13]
MKNNKIIKVLATSGVILSLGMAAFGVSKVNNTTAANSAVQTKAQALNANNTNLVGTTANTKDIKDLNIAQNSSTKNGTSNCPASSNAATVANNSKVGVQAAPNNGTANKVTIFSNDQAGNCSNSASNWTSYFKSNTTKQTTNGSTAKSPSTSTSTATKPSTTTQSTASSDKFIAEIEQLIFNKVNQERAKAGVPQLSYNSTMEHYARIKSQDMGDRGYFDHKNPEGKLMADIMKADGVNYMAWGENIAYIGGVTGNSTLADNFMTNWMNSPGHRANILSTNFSSIGIGVYKIGDTYYATQEFYK